MNQDEEKRKLLYALNDIDDRFIDDAIQYSNKKKRKAAFGFNWQAGLTAAFAILLFGFFTIYQIHLRTDQPDAMQGSPYQEVTDLSEAESITGFTMNVPEAVEPYSHISAAVIDDNMIEVTYSADNGDIGYSLRKGKGDQDISGDYTEYSDSKEISVNNISVLLKGSDGQWYSVTWQSDHYSYAISISNQLMSEEQIIQVIKVMLSA